MNSFLISAPSAFLTGIFCKLGSVEESLPVEVAVCLNTVCSLSFSSTKGSIPNT